MAPLPHERGAGPPQRQGGGRVYHLHTILGVFHYIQRSDSRSVSSGGLGGTPDRAFISLPCGPHGGLHGGARSAGSTPPLLPYL